MYIYKYTILLDSIISQAIRRWEQPIPNLNLASCGRVSASCCWLYLAAVHTKISIYVTKPQSWGKGGKANFEGNFTGTPGYQIEFNGTQHGFMWAVIEIFVHSWLLGVYYAIWINMDCHNCHNPLWDIRSQPSGLIGPTSSAFGRGQRCALPKARGQPQPWRASVNIHCRLDLNGFDPLYIVDYRFQRRIAWCLVFRFWFYYIYIDMWCYRDLRPFHLPYAIRRILGVWDSFSPWPGCQWRGVPWLSDLTPMVTWWSPMT